MAPGSASTSATRHIYTYHGLPNEVWLTIFRYSAPTDLCSWALSCSSLNILATEILYSSVTINDRTALNQFIRPWLRTYNQFRFEQVETLDLSLPMLWARYQDGDTGIRAVQKLVNLKTLRLADMPFPNTFAESLTTCTINSKKYSHRRIGSCEPLFRHRPLTSLTLHYVLDDIEDSESNSRRSDDSENDVVKRPRTLRRGTNDTDLKELRLVDCAISSASLSRMLSFPRALEKLAIFQTENTDDDWRLFRLRRSRLDEYVIDAISQASTARSLLYLHFDMPSRAYKMALSHGLQKLTGLLFLKLGSTYLSKYDRGIENASPTALWDLTSKLLPPNLQVLSLSPNAQDGPSLRTVLKIKPHLYPSWRILIMDSLYLDRWPTAEEARRISPSQWVGDGNDASKLMASQGGEAVRHLEVLSSLKKDCEVAGVEMVHSRDDAKFEKEFEEYKASTSSARGTADRVTPKDLVKDSNLT